MFNQTAIREITETLAEIKAAGGTTTDLPINVIILLEELGYIVDLSTGELLDKIDGEYDQQQTKTINHRRRCVLEEVGWFASIKIENSKWEWNIRNLETEETDGPFSTAAQAWDLLIRRLAPQWDDEIANRLIGLVAEYPIEL